MPVPSRGAAPLAACLLAASAASSHAADALRGGALYQSTRMAPLSCGDNGSCHGPDPRQDVFQIRKGANDAALIESAIARDRGGMGFLDTYVNATDVADIAAWIAGVVDGRIEPPPAPPAASSSGGSGGGAPAGGSEPSIVSPFNAGAGGCSVAHDAPFDPLLPGFAVAAMAALASRRARRRRIAPRSPGLRRAWLATAGGGLLAALLPAGRAQAATGIGQAAADFDLPTIDGARLSMAALRGRVVYLDFWASWCTPCRRSFPWMGALQRRFGPQGLQVVAVNVDARIEDTRRFLAAVPAGFPVPLDPTGGLARAYAIRAMPTSVLIGRDGTVLHVHAGFRDGDVAALEAQVQAALAAPPGALPVRHGALR